MPLRNNLLSYNHESVETNIGSWFANNANTTLTRDTAQAFEGVAAQKLAAVASGNVSSGLTGILVQPSRTFTISCWVWTSTASLTSRIDVDWYTGNGAGSFISTSSTANVAIPTSTWTLVSAVVTSPATAGEARIFVGNATATGAGQAVFVDEVFVGVVGDVAEPSPGPGPGPGPMWRSYRPPLAASFEPADSRVAEVGTTAYTTANATTVTTASFTPSDGSLLVAYCSMGNGVGSASSLGAVTDSLGGSWTRLAGEASASGGVAEVWARDIATGAAMTVTYDPGGAGASGLDLLCKWYANARALAGQPGTTAVNGGTTAYTVSISPTTVGSLIVGSLGRASDAQTVVPIDGTLLLGQVNGSGGDTAAVFRSAATVPAAGPILLGFGNTPAGVNRMALVEILPPSAGVATPGTIVGTTSMPGPTVSAGSAAAVATVAPAAAVISGTAQAGSAAAPSTISGSTTLGAPTVAAGSAPAPVTVPGSTTISGSASTGSTAAPTTISGSTTISGTAQAGSAAAPATVAPPVTVISGSAVTGSTVSAATVAGSTTISGAAQAGAVAAPAAVTGSTTISGAAQAGTAPTPATVAGSITISGTAQAGSVVTPATVAGSTTISGTASGAGVPSPATVAGSTTISGAGAAGSTVTPSTVTAVTTIPAPSVGASAQISPATVSGSTAISGSARTGSTVSPPTVVGSTTISGAGSVSRTAIVVTVLGSTAIGPHVLTISMVAPVSTVLGYAIVPGPAAPPSDFKLYAVLDSAGGTTSATDAAGGSSSNGGGGSRASTKDQGVTTVSGIG